MSAKILKVNGKTCDYIKLDESVEFFCDRCKKRKIAKKYAEYTENGVTKKLCNGCYGKLLSMQNEY